MRPLNKQTQIISGSTCFWRPTKCLRTIKPGMDTCPRCSFKLYAGETVIPVDDTYVAVVSGQKCRRCDCLYITDKHEVERILRDNKNAKAYTLNGLQLWNYTAKCKERKREEQYTKLRGQKIAALRRIPSGVVMLTVQFAEAVQDYVIVDRVKDQDERANVLCYASPLALELLTAAFREDRNGKGAYNGKTFRIADILYPQTQKDGLEKRFLPKTLNIKSGGGTWKGTAAEKEENREFVHVLVYAPFTKRYEILSATYDRLKNYCYTDAALYRAFVSKYGKPGLITGFGSEAYADMDWSDLQIESALKQYGYSVSQKDGLSDRFRQELLGEMVDLELLDIPKIIGLLNFFISAHTGSVYDIARSKWESDRCFISAYKVNPERFLIKQ